MKATNINGQWFFVNTRTGRHVKCHNRATAQELARVARTGIRPHGTASPEMELLLGDPGGTTGRIVSAAMKRSKSNRAQTSAKIVEREQA